MNRVFVWRKKSRTTAAGSTSHGRCATEFYATPVVRRRRPWRAELYVLPIGSLISVSYTHLDVYKRQYKHYAPSAHVVILEGPYKAFQSYVNAHATAGVAALCYRGEEAGLCVPVVCLGAADDSAEQARRLFDALRETDRLGVNMVYARCPSQDGVGLAVYNRLIRAAGFEVLSLA